MQSHDKVAVVTGGTRGIGKAIVRQLVKSGNRVAFTYLNNQKLAADLEAESDGKARAFKVDVRDFEQAKTFVDAVVHEWRTIDILVNNAGIRKDKTLVFLDADDWNDVLGTNLTGMYHITKHCVFYMIKQKSGRIVNISSTSGIVGIKGQTNYSSSKAGVIGFTKALAKEVALYNVSVNALAAGGIETDMTTSLSEKRKEELIKQVPCGRLGTVSEVAQIVSFLVDFERCPSYLTGSTIVFDGGIGN